MREFGKLTARAVAGETKRGMIGDGGGLYLRTSKGGSRSWILRYKRDGKEHHLGLGSLRDVTLSMARDKAREARRSLLDGVDPISARKAAKASARAAKSFRQVADEYIEAHAKSWSARTAEQWRVHLATYILPIIGLDCPVADVDTAMVLKVLTPIWSEKTETANRVRRRIESILDAAKVQGLREGENPAAWKGNLAKVFPNQSEIAAAEHHEAMDWREVPSFLTELRRRPEVAARCLEFAVLTATRTNEVLTAEWGDLDLDQRLWVIPSAKTKTAKEHRVPLSDRAVEIVEAMREIGLSTKYVFGNGANKPLPKGAMMKTLRKIDKAVTTHGFRATFRTWAAETGVPAELAEMALGHTVGDKVERAYQRSDMFARRRSLTDRWAAFCTAERGSVTKLMRA